MMQRLPDAQLHEPKKEKLFFISFMYFEKDKISKKILSTSRFCHTYVAFSEYVCEVFMNK